MGLRALGDSAWLFEAGGNDSRARFGLILRLTAILNRERIPELRDIVSSFDSIAVHFDPSDGGRVFDWLTSLPAPNGDEYPADARTHHIPVNYSGEHGPDLATLAARLGRTPHDIIALHSAAEYTVAAIGFSPGFPYLLGLPDELRVPRLATPRPVPAGSVAIAGAQAGIYPSASQAGWHVLGRTSLPLFDPQKLPPALLKPGDRIRFLPTDRLDAPAPRHIHPASSGPIEVIEPGPLATVQDLGRPGFQHLGVSPGGAADPISATVANRLVGNPDTTAVIECSMSGPLLRFHQPAHVAWVGGTGPGKPLSIPAGGTLDLRGRTSALRAYLAVAGGIDLPPIMGSRATDLRAAFGGHLGRPLASGDLLPIGPPPPSHPHAGAWHVAWPREPSGSAIELRFIKGMQSYWFDRETKDLFRYSTYQISPVSDRMGVRLDGPPLHLPEPRELVSQPAVAGSVQIPPDGHPIILIAERQTIGGYPQIGHVISADLPKLARAWPGTRLRFREVTLDQARDAWRDLQRELGLLHAGLTLLP